MPLISSQQLRSPVRIHKRNSLILIREIHYRTHKFMVIHAPSFIVVHEAKVEDGDRSINKPQCQLYRKMDHTVLKCYHCFNPFFTGIYGYPLNSHTGTTILGSSSNASYAYNTKHSRWWGLVSRHWCNNHVTNEFNNLSIGVDYHGSNKLHMGDGTSLVISHVRHSIFFKSSFF